MVMSKSSLTVDQHLPSLACVLEATSRQTGLSIQEITSPRRQMHKLTPHTRARMLVAYVARETSKRSYPMIAKKLNRNHTTMIHAFNLALGLIRRNDAETITAVAEITRIAWQLHNVEKGRIISVGARA